LVERGNCHEIEARHGACRRRVCAGRKSGKCRHGRQPDQPTYYFDIFAGSGEVITKLVLSSNCCFETDNYSAIPHQCPVPSSVLAFLASSPLVVAFSAGGDVGTERLAGQSCRSPEWPEMKMLDKTEQSDRPNPNEKPENCYCSALPKGSGPCLRCYTRWVADRRLQSSPPR
jgi:hypothetical protein